MTGTLALMDALPWQHKAFMRSMIALARKLPEDVQIIHSGTNYHDEARNQFAETFSGEWLIQFDTDQTFHWNIVDRLIDSADRLGADVLTGVYYRRQVPYWPLLYWRDEEGRLQQYQSLFEVPFTIGAAGAGCLFVRRTVFDRIRDEIGERPFAFIEKEDGGRVAEDIAFFTRCARLDIECWCDPSIRVNHLMWAEVLPMNAPNAAPEDAAAWPRQAEEVIALGE